MTLSPTEIHVIKETLELNKLVYEDIKLELTDHIASAIEAEMENRKVDFNTALHTVFEQWKPMLQPASNFFWLGNFIEGPKIVVNQWVAYSQRQMAWICGFAVIWAVVATVFFNYRHEVVVLNNADVVAKYLFAATVGATILGLAIVWLVNVKTIYSRLFKRRSVLAFFQPLMISAGVMKLYFYDGTTGLTLLTNFLFSWFFFYTLINLRLVAEHLRVIKKYQLI
ncbi:hypothetical protein [Flavobacterium sp. XGLA_31]|uniref:hypothetical protein n=1 Tax=Flavobacterium sp. XGLA_31 TaxID=3447666 RepID=UPI003F2C718B